MSEHEMRPIDVSPAIVTGMDNIAKGREIADVLSEIVNQRKLYVPIQGKKFVTVEGWNTLGAMLGCFPEVVRCTKLDRQNEIAYEAEVIIKDLKGNTITRALSFCSNKEGFRKGADEYVINSMAQTRATGKAFRLAFSWIMQLAGYEVTPAEEIPVEPVPVATDESIKEKKHWRDVTIHFGKNKGRRLGDLQVPQIRWYAESWKPDPKYGIKPEDLELQEALKEATAHWAKRKEPESDEAIPVIELDEAPPPLTDEQMSEI